MVKIPATPFETLDLPDDPPGISDPCWCRSGIEYGRCHLDRHLQVPESKWNLLKQVRKLNQVEYCSHPHASVSTCRGGIVRSHTLQMSGALSVIAVDQHVYGLDVFGQPEPDGRPGYKLIGIRRASTFTGFCAHHDSDTFRPLETRPFIASKEQLFLLAFRAVSKELYAKKFAIRTVPLLRKTDKGKDILHQVALQRNLYLHEQLLQIGLRDLELVWMGYQAALLAGDYDRFSAYVIFTDKLPDFAASGAICPEFDFQGHAIQNLAAPTNLDLITYTVLPLASRGIIALVWDMKNTTSCLKLATSLERLPTSDVPDALVRFTYEHFENCYANPQWWESLSTEQQEVLLRRIALAASDQVNRKSNCLADDGLRVATWKVLAREFL